MKVFPVSVTAHFNSVFLPSISVFYFPAYPNLYLIYACMLCFLSGLLSVRIFNPTSVSYTVAVSFCLHLSTKVVSVRSTSWPGLCYNFPFLIVAAGRRAAIGSNVVLRRFMVDLLHTVTSQYIIFMSEEYRGSYDHYQRERQFHLLQRKIIRWFINNH
jgi:hypothetical protein